MNIKAKVEEQNNNVRMIDKKSKDIAKKAATILIEDTWSHEISSMRDIRTLVREEYKELSILEKIECVFKYCRYKEKISRAYRKVYKMCKRDIEHSHDIIEAHERRIYLETFDSTVDLDCIRDYRGPLFCIGEPHPLLEEPNDEYRDEQHIIYSIICILLDLIVCFVPLALCGAACYSIYLWFFIQRYY